MVMVQGCTHVTRYIHVHEWPGTQCLAVQTEHCKSIPEYNYFNAIL